MQYNRANSHLFVNGTETHTFKAKDSEIDFFDFFDFSVDYGAITVDDVLGIHKYLTKKE